MKKTSNNLLSGFVIALSSLIYTAGFNSAAMAVELEIGQKEIAPGIVFIFEGAVKDTIFPASFHLTEKSTNIHLEARANWGLENIPKGTPPGGFVPYLKINAVVTNQSTGVKTFIDLQPHVNLSDNFHYARNLALPGSIDDEYTVEFKVIRPGGREVGLHKDWVNAYGNALMKNYKFIYRNLNFGEIARATRN